MTRLVLAGNLHLGVPFMDNDHQGMVDLYNDILAMLEQGAETIEVKRGLGKLLRFSREHFDREAGLMTEFDYPGTVSHKAEHDQLAEQFTDFLLQLNDPSVVVEDSDLFFIEDWVLKHIKEADNQFALFLLENHPEAL